MDRVGADWFYEKPKCSTLCASSSDTDQAEQMHVAPAQVLADFSAYHTSGLRGQPCFMAFYASPSLR